jgi:hypothetical protein
MPGTPSPAPLARRGAASGLDRAARPSRWGDHAANGYMRCISASDVRCGFFMPGIYPTLASCTPPCRATFVQILRAKIALPKTRAFRRIRPFAQTKPMASPSAGRTSTSKLASSEVRSVVNCAAGQSSRCERHHSDKDANRYRVRRNRVARPMVRPTLMSTSK